MAKLIKSQSAEGWSTDNKGQMENKIIWSLESCGSWEKRAFYFPWSLDSKCVLGVIGAHRMHPWFSQRETIGEHVKSKVFKKLQQVTGYTWILGTINFLLKFNQKPLSPDWPPI